ncbi:hypothetical protein [Sulfurimonas sp. HSL-1716]|uniref:hypothetical protein n=1 Tax=Hydrocurvibacter sulfurireducens TaxID=3131937 RepID=UPI0031F8D1CC
MKNIVLILLMFVFTFANDQSECEKRDFIPKSKNTAKKSEIQCRCVCDKKISNLQRMKTAIEFYKNSKIYKFSNR